MLVSLNLPSFDCKIKQIDSKAYIYDNIRHKFILLTPEEWVRQHLLHWLIHHCNYPKSLLKIEGGLQYNKLQKRTDILVFDREAKPFLLAECKAPTVKITQKVINQALLYNQIHKATYLLVSNGMQHFVYEVTAGTLVPISQMPVLP